MPAQHSGMAMRFPALTATALLGVAAGSFAPALSTAAEMQAFSIQRCESAQGEVVYTDRSCAASGARPTPFPRELISRIAYEGGHSATLISFAGHFDDASRGPVPKRRSPLGGCARTPRQLSLDLEGAWALHDVNRLAESFHWVGMSHRQSHRVMDRLRQLNDQPVQRAEYFNAQIGPADMPLEGNAGIVQLLLADGSGANIVDLDVRRYSGCYFVTFQRTS